MAGLQSADEADTVDALIPQLRAQGIRADSHDFRLDKPLALAVAGGGSAALENFTRVENLGAHRVHWVAVFVQRT